MMTNTSTSRSSVKFTLISQLALENDICRFSVVATSVAVVEVEQLCLHNLCEDRKANSPYGLLTVLCEGHFS